MSTAFAELLGLGMKVRLGSAHDSKPVERLSHLFGCEAHLMDEVLSALSTACFLVMLSVMKWS